MSQPKRIDQSQLRPPGRSCHQSSPDGVVAHSHPRATVDLTAPEPISTIREELHKLAEKLPPDADWDDVMYEVYVRQTVAEGLRDGDEGRVVPHEEVKKCFRVS